MTRPPRTLAPPIRPKLSHGRGIRLALQIAARNMMTQVTNESWTKIVPQRPPGYPGEIDTQLTGS